MTNRRCWRLKIASSNQIWIDKFSLLIVYPRGIMIFSDGGVPHKVSKSTLSGIFDEKVGPFSEFLCLMEVSKIRF